MLFKTLVLCELLTITAICRMCLRETTRIDLYTLHSFFELINISIMLLIN